MSRPSGLRNTPLDRKLKRALAIEPLSVRVINPRKSHVSGPNLTTIGEVFHSVATKDAHRLSDFADVPEALADVVARCLRRDPAERFADAEALAVALARAIEEREPDAAKLWSLRPRSLPADAKQTPETAPVNPGAVTRRFESPGHAGQEPGPQDNAAHIHVKGDALLYAVDASGNVGASVLCHAPPRQDD